MPREDFTIDIDYCPDSKLWGALSPNIVGLILQDDTLDGLLEEIMLYAPQLLEANHQLTSKDDVSVTVHVKLPAKRAARRKGVKSEPTLTMQMAVA